MQHSFCKTISVFLFVLGSCAHVPKSDLSRVSAPVPLDKSMELALEREFFEAGGWPSEKWWEMFGDSQLNSLIERALQESPTLQKAIARVAKVEEEARKEKSLLWPKINANYEEQWEYFSKHGFVRSFYPTQPSVVVPATTNQLDLTLNFDYEIDFFGKNRNLFRAALGKARAERAEARQATLMLTTLIAQTYIELQTRLGIREVWKERLEQRNQLFQLSQLRGTNGVEMAIPVLEKEQSIYEVEQTLLRLEKEIALDKHLLATLVGVGPDTDLVLDAPGVIFECALSLPYDLPSDLLARRPDLTAQIWRVEAAAREIGAAKADFYPRVNLIAMAGLQSLSFNQLLDMGSQQGTLNPAVHLPIFTGGRLRANLKGKVASFNEETFLYNKMVLDAAREVADQIVTLSATFDTLGCQVNALETAEEQLALQYSRYQHGVNDYLSVLDKEDNLFTQRDQLYGYERDYLLAVLGMIKALGGGYHAKGPLPNHR